MSLRKIDFYREMIKKTHDTFREFLIHLPEDILNWKIHEFSNTVRWLIQHVIQDQMWIANIILDKNEESFCFDKKGTLSLEEIIEGYDDAISDIETKLKGVKEEDLLENRSYKEYSMSVEDWLYEYIHHLNLHSGEIGLTLTTWKRKSRSLEE